MPLTLSRLRAKSATQVTLAACMLVGIASLSMADLGDKLADMTPKDAFDYGVELFDADRRGEAAKVFTYIYEVHNSHELAPWALFRLSKIASSAYKPGEITYNVEQADSQSEALRWLKARRDQCIASLQPLREAPVPESLAATRSAVLAAVGSAEPIWQTAWAEWEAAVRQPKEDAQDYDSVVATVQRKVDEQELLSYSLAAANDAMHEAEQKLGLAIDDAW